MSSRKIGRNLVANLLGQGWTALMALLFVPFYLHFLGAEGFGLIGFFITLTALLVVMDAGMGATATREAAALSNDSAEDRTQLRDSLRTIEVFYFAIATMTGIAFVLLAPFIGEHWLHAPADRTQDVVQALAFMAVALALQFPLGFYSGCLIGLQRQVALNTINAVFATLRGGGAVLVLWLISPTAHAFFAWQCVVSLISVISLHLVTWGILGQGPARFRIQALQRSGRFTAGVGAINVLGLFLTQLDKVLLSKLLSLQAFGYYMVAWTVGTVALRAAGPIFNAYFPAFTQLAITYNAKETLRTTYVQSAMLLAVGVAPITACLVFFGQPLLLAWTGNATLVQAAALPLVLISIGTMCNAFMHVPYALQLAHGKTHLALTQNIIAIALLPPITIYSTLHYGIAGAGVSWFLLNLGYVILSAPLAHRGLLNNVSGRWYRQGIFIPLAVAILVTTPFYALSRVLALGTVFTLSMAAAGLALSVAGCALLVDRGTLSHLFAPSSGERAA